MGLYLITLTLGFNPADPDEVSVEGIRTRADVVRAGWRYLWRRYLKPRSRAALRSIEVSPSGMVHAHVLYHGRRPDVNEVRAAWMSQVGDSPQVNVKYVKDADTGILEVAKYVTKGASPKRTTLLSGAVGEFVDPVLAARVEVAFVGDRLVECYGAWRGIDPDQEEAAPESIVTACPRCGSVEGWHTQRLGLSAWITFTAGDWTPRLSRCGPLPANRFQPPNQTQEEGER